MSTGRGAGRVLVTGAGIGGLTAAIALLDQGFDAQVYEQASKVRTIGAGLTISTGAQRAFGALGLLAEVRARASVMRSLAFVHHRTGELIDGAVDDGDGSLDADGPANIHIHRADLHEILVGALLARAPDVLHLGRRMTGLQQSPGGVRAEFADGTRTDADVLVGADGLRSTVRGILWGPEHPRFAGQVAYRCMIPSAVAEPFVRRHGRTVVYLGPGRVFHRYSLQRGRTVNCVAIARNDSWDEEGWTTPAPVDELADLYAGWHSDVVDLIRVAPPDELKKWALYERPPLERWTQGPVTLLGDAAHPLLPFLGLGAAMAIEDGFVLARALSIDPSGTGLETYERTRRPRTDLVMRASAHEGRLVQGANPIEYDAEAAPSHDDDLYDFDPDAALAAPLRERT